MTPSTVERRLAVGELAYLDYYFARFIDELEGRRLAGNLLNLVADLSHALTDQHSCLDLSDYPDSKQLIGALRELSCVGDGSEPTPLVLEGERLFLHRYFRYETRIAGELIRRSRSTPVDPAQCKRALSAWPATGVDWQQIAALQALTRQLVVITGGPGTGKTTTVVRILAMLLENGDPAIKLAAPTGKAAMRLNQTLTEALPHLPESVRSRLPEQVQTLHRLLGMHSDGRSSRYDRQHKIPVDVLVVDEVSMIDLSMMNRLLLAVPEDAKLILLGDPDQLPSVDAGNILADICRYPADYTGTFTQQAAEILGVDITSRSTGHLLADSICHLRKNYRFSAADGIGRLAAHIREAAADVPGNDDQIQWLELDELESGAGTRLSRAYAAYLERLETGDMDAASLIGAFDRSRILSPVRDGKWSVAAINEEIEEHLRQIGLIQGESRFYHGRPIIIMRNDYNLGLFNGDTGITIMDPAERQPRVAFRGIDGEIRLYLASRLPPHETCFAMTVHKSQGSEFDDVTLVLPDDLSETGERVMTRELLYTAITRARASLAIYSREDVLGRALARRTARRSGLGERFLPSGMTALRADPDASRKIESDT